MDNEEFIQQRIQEATDKGLIKKVRTIIRNSKRFAVQSDTVRRVYHNGNFVIDGFDSRSGSTAQVTYRCKEVFSFNVHSEEQIIAGYIPGEWESDLQRWYQHCQERTAVSDEEKENERKRKFGLM